MVVLLGLVTASAAAPKDRPVPREVMRTYRTGVILGVVGAGMMVGGFAAGAVACRAEAPQKDCLLPFVALLPGLVVAEVGAPVALAGSLEERRYLEEAGGAPPDALAVTGFAAFAVPILGMPVAYTLAAGQHTANRDRLRGATVTIAPRGLGGVAVSGTF